MKHQDSTESTLAAAAAILRSPSAEGDGPGGVSWDEPNVLATNAATASTRRAADDSDFIDLRVEGIDVTTSIVHSEDVGLSRGSTASRMPRGISHTTVASAPALHNTIPQNLHQMSPPGHPEHHPLPGTPPVAPPLPVNDKAREFQAKYEKFLEKYEKEGSTELVEEEGESSEEEMVALRQPIQQPPAASRDASFELSKHTSVGSSTTGAASPAGAAQHPSSFIGSRDSPTTAAGATVCPSPKSVNFSGILKNGGSLPPALPAPPKVPSTGDPSSGEEVERSPKSLPMRTSSFFVKNFSINATQRRQVNLGLGENKIVQTEQPPTKPSRMSFLKKKKGLQLAPVEADPPEIFEELGLSIDTDTLQLMSVGEGAGLPIGLQTCVRKYLTHVAEKKVTTYQEVLAAYEGWKKTNVHEIDVKFSKYVSGASGVALPSVSLPQQVVVVGENDLLTVTPLGSPRKKPADDDDAGSMHRTDSLLGASSVTSVVHAPVTVKHLAVDLSSILAFTVFSTLAVGTPLLIWAGVGTWGDEMRPDATFFDTVTHSFINSSLGNATDPSDALATHLLSMPSLPGIPEWMSLNYFDIHEVISTVPSSYVHSVSTQRVVVIDSGIRTPWAVVECTSIGALQFSVFFCMVNTKTWRWLITMQLVAVVAVIFFLAETKVSGETELSHFFPVLLVYTGTVVIDAVYLKAVGKKRSYMIVLSFVLPALYCFVAFEFLLKKFDGEGRDDVWRVVCLLVIYPLVSFVSATVMAAVSRHGMVADNGFFSVSFSIAILCISSSVGRIMLVRSERWLQCTAALLFAFYHFFERMFYVRKSVEIDSFIITTIYPHFKPLLSNLKEDEPPTGGGLTSVMSINAKGKNLGDLESCRSVSLSMADEAEIWTEGAWFQDSVLAEYFCALCIDFAAIVAVTALQVCTWGTSSLFFDLNSPEKSSHSYWVPLLFVVQIGAEVVAATVALVYQSCPGSSMRISLLEFIIRAARRPRLILLLCTAIFFLLTLTLALSKIELKVQDNCVRGDDPFFGHFACLNAGNNSGDGFSYGGSVTYPSQNETLCCQFNSYLSNVHFYLP